jgi:hypothetical protein
MKVFFSLYMGALAKLGAIGHVHGLPVVASQTPITPARSPRRFEEVDRVAKVLGDLYRGSGICMVGLGALIVLCAVAPLALESEHHAALQWGVAEVTLMALVLVMAMWLRVSNTRRRWIDARHLAESMRYGALESRIAALSSAMDGQGDTVILVAALHQEVTAILVAQISYNQAKHVHYERIEHGGSVFGIAVFTSAMGAAIAHLVVHWPWLLLFTVAGPTLTGAIHGINGFLRITDMSDDHRDTVVALRALQIRLNRSPALPAYAAALLRISTDAYQVLVARDAQWRGKADTLQPKLG